MYSILLGVLAMSATFSQAAPAPTQNPSLALDSTSKLGFANFTQLVSHDDPSLGTFQQQYVYSLDFWSGPGAPIIFGTPGEADLIPAIPAGTGANITDLQLARASYFTSNATTMVLAQQLGSYLFVSLLNHSYLTKSIRRGRRPIGASLLGQIKAIRDCQHLLHPRISHRTQRYC